jgi:hypothetical protein
MIGVVAGNYVQFLEWIRQNFIYIGTASDLAVADPTEVEQVVFVGEFRDNEFYFSDELFKFQMKVALAKQGRDVSEADKFFTKDEDGDDESSD